MEDDDPVVQEIPVFLSQALTENLYIYQYPIKPSNREWNNTKVVNTLIKPKNQVVKMEIGLDTYSDKYNMSKGEQIALCTDGHQEPSRYMKDREREKSRYFKSSIMDKIAYESNAPCPASNQYVVAMLQDKELHCTPVKEILQLRPSYSYYDKQNKKNKGNNSADKSDDEEEEIEAQQVTVKFSKQESDIAKKAREKSFEFLAKKSQEEPWYEALYRHDDTDHADLERLKLLSASVSGGATLGLRGSRYLRTLVPPENSDAPPPSASDQCSRLLLSAKMLTFSELRNQVRDEAGAKLSPGVLLSAVTAAGCCVRGLWTPRSADLLVQPSARVGVPAASMCAARDHILYLFTQSTYVDRVKVAATVRLPPEEVLDILKTVAKYRPDRGWELLLSPDIEFEAKYPDVMQRQNLYWEGKQRQFIETLIGETLPKRQRKKSQRDSVSSDTMLSPKVRCNSMSEEDSDSRKRPKNKSSSGLGKRTRLTSSSSMQDAT